MTDRIGAASARGAVLWSNVVYVSLGVFSGDPVLMVLLPLMGVASYLYHSKRVAWGGSADVAMMFATLSGLTVVVYLPWYAALGVAAVVAVATWHPWWSLNLSYKIGPFWAVWITVSAFAHPDWLLFGGGLACFGGALGFWLHDPEYDDWRHGGWHALTAAGFLALRLAVVLG